MVDQGEYNATDGTQGEPYLARLFEDGSLTRLRAVPTHDVLEASEQWLAYVPPGTVGGEASAASGCSVWMARRAAMRQNRARCGAQWDKHPVLARIQRTNHR